MPSAFSRPPMRCSRPGRAGHRPRPGQRLRVAQVRPERRLARRRRSALGSVAKCDSQVGQVVDVREQPRLGAVGQVAVGQQDHRRAVGRRRSGPPRCAASKQSAGERGATTGTGASPLRPNIACSRSACSVLVGRPVDGPPRWMSHDHQRQLQRSPPGRSSRTSARRPGRTSWSRRARRRRRRRAPRRSPAISSSAWNVRHAEALVLGQLVQDVARPGVIGYAPRNSGSPAALRRRRPARTPARCCR